MVDPSHLTTTPEWGISLGRSFTKTAPIWWEVFLLEGSSEAKSVFNLAECRRNQQSSPSVSMQDAADPDPSPIQQLAVWVPPFYIRMYRARPSKPPPKHPPPPPWATSKSNSLGSTTRRTPLSSCSTSTTQTTSGAISFCPRWIAIVQCTCRLSICFRMPTTLTSRSLCRPPLRALPDQMIVVRLARLTCTSTHDLPPTDLMTLRYRVHPHLLLFSLLIWGA
ncbi:hypothetical protein EDD15DRAFT_2284987 [Pisolithus albus]|nr:hypothetical protein EDD15DRAFT_2284987 [Pisolithus albus]